MYDEVGDVAYFLDEGDELMRLNMIDCDEKSPKVKGLVSLRGKLCFLFSATVNEYWYDLLQSIFSVTKDVTHNFPALSEIVSKTDPINVSYHLECTDPALMKAASAKISQLCSKNIPVIVFINTREEK